MLPIYEDVNRTTLIADKRRTGSANLFGIIAFTDANPNIKKLLRDKDYWDCFDALSCGWIIYAIRPEYGQRISYSPSGTKSDKPQFDFNYDFLSDFGIKDTEHFPMLIVCALAENDKIESIRVDIDDSSVEVSANNLKELITEITGVLQQVDDRYKSSKNVLREVEKDLSARNARVALKKASKAFIQFLTTVSSLCGIA